MCRAEGLVIVFRGVQMLEPSRDWTVRAQDCVHPSRNGA
jgi:hypothetical protein